MKYYHGSEKRFGEFNLNNLGANGTAQGSGVYLTPNEDMAEMYANIKKEQGYLYEVTVELGNPLSLSEITIKDNELSEIIDLLQRSNDILNDYNDVDYYGEKTVKREAIAMLKENENDVDLMNELNNITGDTKCVSDAFKKAGNYTHAIADNQLRQQDEVVIVFDPADVMIKEVTNLTAEKLTKEQIGYWQVQVDNELSGYRGHDLFVERFKGMGNIPAVEKEQLVMQEISKRLDHYIELVPSDERKTVNLMRRGLKIDEEIYDLKKITNKDQSNTIRGYIINDFQQEIDPTRYYDKNSWIERVESIHENNIVSNLSIDEDVEMFYKENRREVEAKVNSLSNNLSMDKNEMLGFTEEKENDVDYKRVASNVAYKLALTEIRNDLIDGTFKIPEMSKEMEAGILENKKFQFNNGFEIE